MTFCYVRQTQWKSRVFPQHSETIKPNRPNESRPKLGGLTSALLLNSSPANKERCKHLAKPRVVSASLSIESLATEIFGLVK